MRLAMRIRQLRFEHFLSLEELAPQARMTATFLARIENGKEIPSLEMIDSLAAAMCVRVASLFYDESRPASTPWLTGRPSFQELAEETFHSRPPRSASLLTFKSLRAVGAEVFSFITSDRRHLLRKPPPPRLPISNSRKQNGKDSSPGRKDTEPKP